MPILRSVPRNTPTQRSGRRPINQAPQDTQTIIHQFSTNCLHLIHSPSIRCRMTWIPGPFACPANSAFLHNIICWGATLQTTFIDAKKPSRVLVPTSCSPSSVCWPQHVTLANLNRSITCRLNNPTKAGGIRIDYKTDSIIALQRHFSLNWQCETSLEQQQMVAPIQRNLCRWVPVEWRDISQFQELRVDKGLS